MSEVTTLPFDYQVRVSRRAKRLQVRITSLGEIEVVLPQRVSPRHIEPFISRHQDWISRTQAKFLAQQPHLASAETVMPDVIELKAANRQFHVQYDWSDHSRARLREMPDRLYVCARDLSHARDTLQNWLTDKARQHLGEQLRCVAGELGFSYRRYSIRAQKTRWGSCSSTGTISLNRALLFVAPELVRYLMIHELCHTVHMNHSPRFWQLVAHHEPDYKACERQLHEASLQVPLWARGK